MWLVLFIITEKTYEFDWCCNSHFVSEYQIENKANDSKHNAHACEYTVGDEEPHCHGLMLMTSRGASCIHKEHKSQEYASKAYILSLYTVNVRSRQPVWCPVAFNCG